MRKAFPSCCLNGVGQLSNEGGPLANEGWNRGFVIRPCSLIVAGIFCLQEDI